MVIKWSYLCNRNTTTNETSSWYWNGSVEVVQPAWLLTLTLVVLNLFLGDIEIIFAFLIISLHLNRTGNWNSFLWKTMTSASYRVNAIVADDLVTQGARASATMAYTPFSQNKLVWAPAGWTCSVVAMWYYWYTCCKIYFLDQSPS